MKNRVLQIKTCNRGTNQKEQKHNAKENQTIEGKEGKDQRRNKSQLEKNVWNGNKYISINNYPNVNGSNAPIKEHGVADWLKTQEPTIGCQWQRLTLGQRIHIDWMWGEAKRKWQESGSDKVASDK